MSVAATSQEPFTRLSASWRFASPAASAAVIVPVPFRTTKWP